MVAKIIVTICANIRATKLKALNKIRIPEAHPNQFDFFSEFIVTSRFFNRGFQFGLKIVQVLCHCSEELLITEPFFFERSLEYINVIAGFIQCVQFQLNTN